jgi:hypothetical protein
MSVPPVVAFSPYGITQAQPLVRHTLVYPTIETTEENRMSKRPHTAFRGTEYYAAPKGRCCGRKKVDHP